MNLSATRSDLDALRRIWRDLAEFPASQTGNALDQSLNALAGLIGVERIWWIAAHRQPSSTGWEPKAVRCLNGACGDQELLEELSFVAERSSQGAPPVFHVRRLLRMGRECHVERPCDVMTQQEWWGDWYFHDFLKPLGFDDLMVGTYELDPQWVAHVGMDRSGRTAAFSDRERDVLDLFLAGAPSLQRELLRFQGLMPSARSLAPRARDVLTLLLTDLSEKQIAAELGLTTGTTHQYVTAVFRHFGVSGRSGLMALFLRHDSPRLSGR